MGNRQRSSYYPQQQTRASNYLGADLPGTRTLEDIDMRGGLSDAELERAVQELLLDADLNTVIKRKIRRRLEERFNAAIDRVSLGHA